LLNSASTASRPFLLLVLAHQRVGWGCTRCWEGAQPGQLTQTDQGDIPHRMMLCLAIKAEGRRRKGEHFEFWHLSSQVTVTLAEALLSQKWLNICLQWEVVNEFLILLCLCAQFLL